MTKIAIDLVVLVVVAIAVAIGLYEWWYQRKQSK